MPDPVLYLKAMTIAAIVGALCVLTMAALRRTAGRSWRNSACVAGMTVGLTAGYSVMLLQPAWPPTNGLDRFLTIVIPFVLMIELAAGFQRLPNWCVWLLRIIPAVAIPRILLHGSVYLSGSDETWTTQQAATVLSFSSLLLITVWGLLSLLAIRSPGLTIPLAVCLAIQCAGATVMMAGYIKGGAAALPLAATLAAVTVTSALIAMRSAVLTKFVEPSIVGVGVVGLFGLLFIGRFFGRLSTSFAMAMLLAPLLCWATELPFLRQRKPWVVGAVRLVLVAILLAFVLVSAKRNFDRDIAPLL